MPNVVSAACSTKHGAALDAAVRGDVADPPVWSVFRLRRWASRMLPESPYLVRSYPGTSKTRIVSVSSLRLVAVAEDEPAVGLGAEAVRGY